MAKPSRNGVNGNGRSADGRFAKGNPGGPGNPYSQRTSRLRAMLLDSITEDDFRAVVAKLIAMAKAGDIVAIRELLDRALGKSKGTVELIQAEITEAELDKEIEYALGQLADLRKAQAS